MVANVSAAAAAAADPLFAWRWMVLFAVLCVDEAAFSTCATEDFPEPFLADASDGEKRDWAVGGSWFVTLDGNAVLLWIKLLLEYGKLGDILIEPTAPTMPPPDIIFVGDGKGCWWFRWRFNGDNCCCCCCCCDTWLKMGLVPNVPVGLFNWLRNNAFFEEPPMPPPPTPWPPSIFEKLLKYPLKILFICIWFNASTGGRWACWYK